VFNRLPELAKAVRSMTATRKNDSTRENEP
jgi:hypothetical protein